MMRKLLLRVTRLVAMFALSERDIGSVRTLLNHAMINVSAIGAAKIERDGASTPFGRPRAVNARQRRPVGMLQGHKSINQSASPPGSARGRE